MTKKTSISIVDAAAFALLLDKKNVQTVPVDGLGDVGVLEFSGSEREAYEQFLQHDAEKSTYVRAELVKRSACDENGTLLFADWEVAKVGALPVSVLKPIYEKSLIVNGFKAEALAEAEKN